MAFLFSLLPETETVGLPINLIIKSVMASPVLVPKINCSMASFVKFTLQPLQIMPFMVAKGCCDSVVFSFFVAVFLSTSFLELKL